MDNVETVGDEQFLLAINWMIEWLRDYTFPRGKVYYGKSIEAQEQESLEERCWKATQEFGQG